MSEARRGRVLVGDGARGNVRAWGNGSVVVAVQAVRGACSDAVVRSVRGWRELKRASHLILPRQGDAEPWAYGSQRSALQWWQPCGGGQKERDS